MAPPQAHPRNVSGHAGGVDVICIDPQGRWLASAGSDGTVRLWDADSGAERHRLSGHRGGVLALAVDPQRRWLASAGSDGTVRLWTTRRSDRTPVCEIALEDLPEAGWVVWRDPDGPDQRWVHWSRNAWRWLRWHAPLPDGRNWMHYPMDAFRGRQAGDG